MDNFDHTEVTLSGIGGSHDTILMLFQNQNKKENSPKALSKKPRGSPQNQKSLDKILPCQELIKIGKFGGRGKIPEISLPGDEIDLSWNKNEFLKQYRLWTLARYKDKSLVDIGPHILSFAVVKRLLYSSTHFITKCAFTSILPYPATEYNSIFTTMIQSFLGTPFFDIASRVFWDTVFWHRIQSFLGTPFFDIASRVFWDTVF